MIAWDLKLVTVWEDMVQCYVMYQVLHCSCKKLNFVNSHLQWLEDLSPITQLYHFLLLKIYFGSIVTLLFYTEHTMQSFIDVYMISNDAFIMQTSAAPWWRPLITLIYEVLSWCEMFSVRKFKCPQWKSNKCIYVI